MREIEVALGARAWERARRGSFVRVDLGGTFPFGELRARSVVVARIAGRLVGYANVCRHQAVPLDFGGDAPMAEDGYHLACHQHGALYRPTDGVCVLGPCVGERLAEVDVEERGGLIVVRVPEG